MSSNSKGSLSGGVEPRRSVKSSSLWPATGPPLSSGSDHYTVQDTLEYLIPGPSVQRPLCTVEINFIVVCMY